MRAVGVVATTKRTGDVRLCVRLRMPPIQWKFSARELQAYCRPKQEVGPRRLLRRVETRGWGQAGSRPERVQSCALLEHTTERQWRGE
jgi:hypothetical protein